MEPSKAQIDFEEHYLKQIRAQVKAAREYFKTHDATASEMLDRGHLGRLEFLLSVIDRMRDGTH